MTTVHLATYVVVAYLVGAIPFGLLIGLARGVDIRRQGSRNIGATNAGRVLGRPWGLLCLALDLLKGFAPVLAASFSVRAAGVSAATLGQWLCVAVAAVLGHVFPVYLRFRGGKGVATTVGVALGVFPYLTVPMAAALVGYAVVRKATGYVSAGSLTIAALFPVAFGLYVALDPGMDMSVFWPLQVVTVLLGVLIVLRHGENIRRIARGEEGRSG